MRNIKTLKKENGITLVSLTITVIIVIILAAVSINLTISNNGVLKNAEEVVTKNSKRQIKEDIELVLAELQRDYYNNYSKNAGKEFDQFAKEKLENTFNMSNETKIYIEGNYLYYKYKKVKVIKDSSTEIEDNSTEIIEIPLNCIDFENGIVNDFDYEYK